MTPGSVHIAMTKARLDAIMSTISTQRLITYTLSYTYIHEYITDGKKIEKRTLTKAVEKIVMVITCRAFITENVLKGFVGYPLLLNKT